MKRKELSVLVVIETTIIGLAAMGVFALLMDQYERARDTLAERTAVVQSTQVFVALLSATPPTPTATNTRTPTRTSTPTLTPLPSLTATPTLSPTPSLTPLPTLPPTPRPTLGPTSVLWNTLTQCADITDAGNYRLGADITGSGECIRIHTSYVVFDCNGHAIRGVNYLGYGVAIHKYGLFNSQTPAYVEVRNCRVSNFLYGIFAEAGNHLAIHDNDSSNNFDDVDPVSRFGKFLGMTEGGGIRFNNVNDSQISSNTTLNQAIGIDIRNSSGVVVKSNTASSNSAWGINLLRTQNSEASNNTTTDNVRKCQWGAGTIGWGCDAGGIVIQDGSNGNLIANNMITGRNGNGVFIKAHALPCGSNNSIIGNTINSVLYNAVELGFCTGNRINNNTMRDGLDGVWLGFARNTEIKNNTVVNMRNHGIISSNSHDNTVSGNQIISSNEGLYFSSDDYDRAAFAWLPPGDYTSHGNCLCGNTLQSNTVAVHLMDSTNNQVTNNTFQNNQRTFWVQGNGDGNNLQGFSGAPLFWRTLAVAALWSGH